MTSVAGSRFVGREAEVGLLRAGLAAALGGEGQLLALLGEPGIGKTRTATVVAAEAQQGGASVAWGRCHDGAGAPAYHPWVQALESYAAQHASDDAAGVARLVPVLRAGAATAEAGDVPQRARFALFETVAATLLAAARRRPLVIVLDDLHWADVASLRLLEFVAREVRSAPLLLLVTLRDVELPERADAGAGLEGLLRLGRNVSLGGLARPAVRDLLTDRLGTAPDDGVVDEVLGVSQGNPFFVIEMAHLLAAPGGPAVPPGVAALLRQRLAALPPPSLGLLRAGSVLGREFDLATLAAMLDLTTEEALDALDPALRLDLVRPSPGRLQHYAFAHALTRETLYDQLAPAARARLHAEAGRVLEAAGPLDDDRLPLLAHHLYEAARRGTPTKAIRYACQAGERALRLLAFEEAVRHFEHTLAALALADDPDARLRALVGLGEALHGAGERARADAALHDAAVLARGAAPGTFAETALRCAAVRTDLGVLDVVTNDLLADALARLPEAPGPVRARVMGRLAAGLLLEPGAEERRRQLADDALAMAREIGDPATLAFVLSCRMSALLGPDNLEERLAATDELLHIRTEGRGAELEAQVFRIGDLAESGDRAALDHALAAFEQRAGGSRHPFFRWSLTTFRAAVALLEGRYADAEALAGDALAAGQQAQARTALLNYAQQLFLLRGEQDRLAEVEPLLVAGATETAVVPAWRCGLADFYSVTGRLTEARREFDGLATDDFAGVPRDTTWLTAMSLLAGVCGRLGDARRAAILYDLLRPYAGRIAIARPLVVLVGSIDHRLGGLAALLDRREAADAHFGRALAIAERMRALPWQAHVRWEWAEALGRRREAARARRLLDEADTIAQSLGMALLGRWIAETRATVAAAARPHPAPPASGRAPGHRAQVVALVPRTRDGPDEPAPRSGVLCRDGDVWTIAVDGRTISVRHMVGLAYLARLVAEPRREFHVLDLVAEAQGAAQPAERRLAVGDAGEQLDAQARASYERRLRDAREELEESIARNDRGRIERLQHEIEFVAGELSRGYGLHGRARRAGSAPERARVAVTRAIKYALDRIAEHEPAVAEHLRLAVRTGTFCAYEPPSRDRIVWTL